MKYFRIKQLLYLSLFFEIFYSVSPVLVTIVLGDMFNIKVYSDDFLSDLKNDTLKLVYFHVTTIVLSINWYSSKFLFRDLRKKVYHKYINLYVNYFDKVITGIMTSRLSQDITLVNYIYIKKFI